MKANNYEVAEAGETITFKGLVARSTSQAFFLVFCTAIGMASLALVLQIQFQDLGEYIMLLYLSVFEEEDLSVLSFVLFNHTFSSLIHISPTKQSTRIHDSNKNQTQQ